MKASDILPGAKINRFTIIKFSHKDKRHRKWWLCRCDCGKEKTVHGSAMISGNTKSCGCLAREVKASTRLPDNHSEITAIILGYKRHARGRGLDWDLKREEVELIIKKPCHYCGSQPSNLKKTKNSLGDGFRYSGMDRVDSSDGYNPKNVVPACKVCNYAKSNMSLDEFKSWAKQISSFADQWGRL